MKLKRIDNQQRHEEETGGFLQQCRDHYDVVRNLIARAKDAVLRDHAELASGNGRLLKLALNEAEALAWQTEHPHLFFPVLALEKAESAVGWHRRQRAIRRVSAEVAFAE